MVLQYNVHFSCFRWFILTSVASVSVPPSSNALQLSCTGALCSIMAALNLTLKAQGSQAGHVFGFVVAW
jgi:hypothetical protein